MTRLRPLHLAAPLLALATSACFATRSDLQVIQQDIATVRTDAQRSDSLQRTSTDRLLATLRAVNDTLGQLSIRMTRFQGSVQGQVSTMAEQLLTIQELTGQTQAAIQRARADIERQRAGGAAPLPGTPGAAGAPAPTGTGSVPPTSSTTPVTGGAPAGGPGPNQLFQASLDQLRRGSTATARTGFQDLLRQYPDDDNAPEALFYVAETYASEGNAATADSTYMQVVQRYPSSPRAATALYKHALAAQQGGRTQEARKTFQDVIDRFPRSDEAALARDRLRSTR